MMLSEPRKIIKTMEIEFEGYRLGVYGPRNVLICKWAQSFNEACDAPRSPWIDPQGKLVVYNKGHKRYSNEVQYHRLTAEPGDWIFYNKEIGFKVLSDAAVRRTLKEKDPAVKPGDFVLSSGEHAKVYVGPLGADFEKDRSKFSDIGFMDLSGVSFTSELMFEKPLSNDLLSLLYGGGYVKNQKPINWQQEIQKWADEWAPNLVNLNVSDRAAQALENAFWRTHKQPPTTNVVNVSIDSVVNEKIDNMYKEALAHLKLYNNGLYGKINKTVENTLKGYNKVSADNAIFIQKNSLGKVVAQPGFMSADNLPDPDVAMAKEIFDTVEDALSANQEAANATEYGFQIHIDWTKK